MYPQVASVVCDLIIQKMNNSNIFEIHEQVQKYEVAKLDEFIVGMIQSNTHSLLQNKSFLNIHKSTLEFILGQTKLNVSEPDLFNACIQWARAECARNQVNNPLPSQLRQILGDLVYFIRIFSFTPKTFIDGPCQSEIFTKEEMFEILFRLQSSQNLTNEFVSKFNPNARLYCGAKWVEFSVLNQVLKKSSQWHKYNGLNTFTFDSVVYLQGFLIKKSNFGKSSIKRLTVQSDQNSEIFFTRKNIVFYDEKYEILFDFPIVLKPEKFYIELEMYCPCKVNEQPFSGQSSMTLDNKKSINCEFSLCPLPINFVSFSLLLY